MGKSRQTANIVSDGLVSIDIDNDLFKVGTGVTIYAPSGIISATGLYVNGTQITNSGISSVFEDTTPTLGGNLNLNSNDITGTGNLNVSGIVTATSFIKNGGASSEFLKADGSVDTSTYLTSYTETQTLDDVTTLGNTTNNSIGIGTDAPEEKLTVYKEGVAALFRGDNYSITALTSTPRLRFGTDTAYTGYMELGAFNSINNLDTKGRDFNLFSSSVDPILYVKNDTGNIGIGTDNPTEELDVYKTSNDVNIRARTTTAGAYFNAQSGISDYYGLRLYRGSTENWFIGAYGSANLQIKDGAANGGTEVFTIEDGTGNVGIGTNDPQNKLDVRGDVRIQDSIPTILFRSPDGSSNQYYIGANISDSVDGGLRIGEGSGITGGTTRISISNAGDVGIGTDSPLAKLEVKDGSVYVPGGTFNASSLGVGNDSVSDAALVMDRGSAIYVQASGYLRKVVESNGTELNIGQQNTSHFTEINLRPGNASTNGVKLHHGGTADNVKLQTNSNGIAVSGIVTAISGVVTYYGDGSNLTGISAGYSDSDVDTHLNKSSASSNYLLRWNGQDYDWIAQSTFLTAGVADIKTSGNLTFNDNVYLNLGTGQNNDSYLFYDGTNANFHVASGDLILATKGGEFAGDDIIIESADDFEVRLNAGTNVGTGITAIYATGGGSVKLNHNGSTKFETTSGGIDVTGHTETDTLNVSGIGTFNSVDAISVTIKNSRYLYFGNSNEGSITYDAANLEMATSSGDLNLKGSGSVALFEGTSKKLETTSYGIYVTGAGNTSTIAGADNLVLDPLAVGDNTGTVIIKGNLQVDGTQTVINSTTMTVDDLNITLADGAANASAANGAGLTVDGANATLTYFSTPDSWEFNKDLILDTTDATLKIKAGGTGTRGAVDFTFNTDSTVYGSLELDYDNRVSEGLLLKSGYPITIEANSNQYIKFRSGTTEHMRITSAGNVGINTTTPDGALDVLFDTSAGNRHFFTSGSLGTRLQRRGDTTAWAMDYGFETNDGTNVGGFGAHGTHTGLLKYYIGSSYQDTKFVIESGGDVGIGTDSPGAKLDVNGEIKTVDINVTSDINLKTNVKSIQDPLEKVLQIRGVTFDWKSSHKSSAGVIAQEVEKILPELVTDSGTKSVNYNGLIGLLIETVKEQQVQINELNSRLSKLE